MNAFLNTVVYGLAALCLLLLSAGITALIALRQAGVITPERIRDYLLSDEEQRYLAAMRARPPEPPAASAPPSVDHERLLADIAEIAHARHASALIEELRRRRDALDERERWLDAREAELRAARADLARLASQLEARRQALAEAERQAAEERARFARLQAEEQARVAALAASEDARYRELARLYELQKNEAWQTLRRLEPREVARILDRMDPKKAANLLKLAAQDRESPMAVALHRELLQLRPAEPSEQQLRRLARLYSFMKPEQVLPYIRSAEPAQIAQLLAAMAEEGASPRDRAALLAALAREDPERERAVARLLQPPAPVP
ncbi:MAG: hypothetical protein RMM29_04355 [Planctomycetota bacterium]|nr:hypothetical protein [Planctomycetota bacterium]MCX8040098.1 hypothetical protein [Planctomycetota bacterium]MDW8372867.1 hypothetical protein [Planctomycetota bacterium]